jgi:hypothetical protein
LEPSNKDYSARVRALRTQVAAEEKTVAQTINNRYGLLAQFSQWDGSHRKVEAAIKARMNDPDSYKHVETRFTETPTGAIIFTKFRGTNGFGGVITTTAVATVDHDGEVLTLHF